MISFRHADDTDRMSRSGTYFQATPSRNGSPSQVSMAQNGKGIRTQFRPAAAIAAKSSSV